MPGADGVNGDPVNSELPPLAALYQSTISPAPTDAVNVGTGEPAQYEASTPTGGFTGGQLQSGAFMVSVLSHPFCNTVSVIAVAEGIPVMLQLFPPVLVTVPAVELTDPPLAVTSTDQVSRSAAQLGPLEILNVGSALTVI